MTNVAPSHTTRHTPDKAYTGISATVVANHSKYPQDRSTVKSMV